jgi:hypothetical protein
MVLKPKSVTNCHTINLRDLVVFLANYLIFLRSEEDKGIDHVQKINFRQIFGIGLSVKT